MRWCWIAAVVLGVRVANADAPHGRYWLDVLDPPYGTFFVKDKLLASCGDRTKSVLAKLHSFKIVYSQTLGRPPVEEVLVDREPWTFNGISEDALRLAMVESPRSNGIQVALSFGLESRGAPLGIVWVVLWDGPNIACGDSRRLGGSYSSSLRPPRGLPP